MVNESIFIKSLRLDDIRGHGYCHFINCIIDTIDFVGAFELHTHLIFENCIINNLQIHSCWFVNGLVIKNCIIKNYVDYQMGGHNSKPVVFDGNIFMEFFNFFDCQFDDIVEIKNNILIKGSNLLGNRGEGFENSFEKGWLEEANLGKVNVDGLGI